MKQLYLGASGLPVPSVAMGCMRISSHSTKEVSAWIQTALDAGANFFDHADIYGGGACEEKFAEAVGMTPRVRETLLIQTKCGIRSGMYDFSLEHIMSSVEGSLKRLRTDYLDVLLLHRPDALMEPEEVAEAFTRLRDSGKVRHFGVSNQNPMQMELLRRALPMPLVANQLQTSLANCTMITSGLNVNMEHDPATVRDGSVLDYCRLHGITIQNWSPFQHGFFQGSFIDSPDYPELNREMAAVAADHGVSKTTVAIAWLLRHPAKFQPIIGTTDPVRVKDSLRAADITLTREEWYRLLRAAGNRLP